MDKHDFEEDYFCSRTNWCGRKVDIEDKSIVRMQERKFNFILNNTYPFLKNGNRKIAFCAGCGVGTEANILEKLGYRVEGCDISDYAIKRLGKKGFFVHNLEKPFNVKNRYDLVIMLEVLEHLMNPKKALKNINEIMKNKGTLIATTPNKNSPYYPFNIFFDRTHISIKASNEWFSILSGIFGCTNIITCQTIPFFWKTIKFPLIGNSLIISCRKI